jgi:hypothetical protein
VTSWTHHIIQTQTLNSSLLEPLRKLTLFHCSESATPPGEHNTSPPLKGTRAAGMQIAPPCTKVVAINKGKIHLCLLGVGQNNELTSQEFGGWVVTLSCLILLGVG